MPALVDTSIRLLAQEPLAGLMPTAELLRLAEILDKAGFAYLEVSGGGVFDTAVRRGVESPWERIRALNERTETPLAMALRGRFLVGSRPVGGEFVSRFVASAADSTKRLTKSGPTGREPTRKRPRSASASGVFVRDRSARMRSHGLSTPRLTADSKHPPPETSR